MALGGRVSNEWDASASEAAERTDETELIEALRRAEPFAAEALCRKLGPSVHRALWKFAPGLSVDREDLVQITFERLILSIVTGRYSGDCSLVSWAMSIAKHAAIDQCRARQRERRLFCDEEEYGVEAFALDGERTLSARSDVHELMRILSGMRPLDARVLLLRFGLGCSIAEVASKVGASETAIGSRLMRARRELLRRAARHRVEFTHPQNG
jgi:RNA polymerase sigma-70 factor (ECF subfamily)